MLLGLIILLNAIYSSEKELWTNRKFQMERCSLSPIKQHQFVGPSEYQSFSKWDVHDVAAWLKSIGMDNRIPKQCAAYNKDIKF